MPSAPAATRAPVLGGHPLVEKKGKKNLVSGRMREVEGLPAVKAKEAFKLSHLAAERSPATCAVAPKREPITECTRLNAKLRKWRNASGYQDAKARPAKRTSALELGECASRAEVSHHVLATARRRQESIPPPSGR